jgi:MFS transporter, PPP family, 3-phenylpropionic acid transporter
VSATAPKLWPFGLFGALYFGFVGIYNPYLPLFLKDLGFGTIAIAFLATINNITRCIGPYAWGWLGDHTGKRLLIVRACCAAALMATAVFFASPVMAVFVIGLFAFNMATSSLTALTESMLLARVQGLPDMWGRYGRVRVWGSFGFLVTVFASGYFFEWVGIGAFKWLALMLVLLLIIGSFTLSADTAGIRAEVPPKVLPLLREPLVAGFFLASFLMIAAHTGLYVFFSLYLDSLGYPKSVIGLLWVVAIGLEMVWFYFQGALLTRFALPTLWWTAALVAAVRFALTGAFGQSIAMLVFAQTLHTLTFAAHHTASMDFIRRHFPGALAWRFSRQSPMVWVAYQAGFWAVN